MAQTNPVSDREYEERRRPRVLVVDDEQSMRQTLTMLLEDRCDVATARDLDETRAELPRAPVDVVFLDIRLERESGLDFLPEMASRYPDVPVVVATVCNDKHTILACGQGGACDYLIKPFENAEFEHVLTRALNERAARLELRGTRPEADDAGEELGIIGRSKAVRQLRARIKRAAQHGARVLILGETGSGKELAARAVHARWHGLPAHDEKICGAGILPAKNSHPLTNAGKMPAPQSIEILSPFIPFNCGAYPPDLVANELFGHEKGAYTGAHTCAKGAFERAHNGTLFLDEINKLPFNAQSILLRVLEDGKIPKLGGEGVAVNVKIIAAANEDLKLLVEHGIFRRDLYHRLAVEVIRIPPLRERLEDLPLLTAHFLRKICAERNRPVPRIDPRAIDYLLQQREWEGQCP